MPYVAVSGITEPIHIVLGYSGAGMLRGRNVIVLTDNLACGPSNPDPVRHGEMRQAYWQIRGYQNLETAIFTAPRLAAAIAAYSETCPVVLWTAALWRESLSFWWTLDAIERTGLRRDRFLVAQPQSSSARVLSLGCFPRECWEDAFANRRLLRHQVLRSGAALWRKYAASSPRGFDRVRRGGLSAFPDLGSIGESHGWFFPQATSRTGRVRLSRLDQDLFDHLSTGHWVSPHAFLQDYPFAEAFLSLLGDESLPHRLHDWATHRAEQRPSLVVRSFGGRNNWTNVGYRLTPHGERVREEGLEVVDEGPPMFIGGCRVYTGMNPWVRHNRRGAWHIDRLYR